MHNMLLYVLRIEGKKLKRTHWAMGYENFIATIILLFFTYMK